MTTNTVETPEKNVAGQQQGAVAVSSGAAAQNNLRNIGLIIGREYRNLVKRRSFIITSVLLLVIVFLAAFIPTVGQLITARTPSQTQIVVVNDAGTVAGLNDVALTSYIGTELNGPNTRSQAPYAISSQPPIWATCKVRSSRASWISCWCLIARRTRIYVLCMTPTSVPPTTATCPPSRGWPSCSPFLILLIAWASPRLRPSASSLHLT